MDYFQVPLDTFYRPIEFPEFINKNLDDKQFVKTVGSNPNLSVKTYGSFLSDKLKQQVLSDPRTTERIEQLRQGAAISNLNKPDEDEKVAAVIFDKFSSAAEEK